MSRAHVPASPAEDLARAFLAASGDGPPRLSPPLAEFIQSGVAVCVAARGTDGRPIPGFAHGVRMVGNHVRLAVDQTSYSGLVSAIAAGSPIAATFTRAVDHRSIQLKSDTAEVCPAEPADLEGTARQASAFRDELIQVAYPPAWSTIYMTFDRSRMAVLEFVPQSAFVQTPGPGAGGALKR